MEVSFSVGFSVTNQVKDAIGLVPESVWATRGRSGRETPAGRRFGSAGRPGRRTHLAAARADQGRLAGRDAGPGPPRTAPPRRATVSLMEAHDGWRYQCVATDTRRGQLPFLEARHRAHARVEDRVKAIKQTGMGRFPSREFAINQAWLQLALTADRPDRLDPDHPARRRRWPRPRPSCCATGCCTSPPASSAANAESGSRSTPAGPGPASSPTRSTASPRSGSRCSPDPATAADHPPPEEPGEPDTRPAHQPAHTTPRSTTQPAHPNHDQLQA